MSKGKLRARSGDSGKKIAISPDTTEEDSIIHPVFCFRYLNKNYNIKKCTAREQQALLEKLHFLSEKTWTEIQFADKHSFGTEKIKQTSIKAGKPPHLSKDVDFYAFRFDGLKPMVGFRNAKASFVFHVVYLDRDFTLYDH